MSNKNHIKLDFPNKLLRYEIKEYLEYNFKVYIEKNNQDLIVYGKPGDLTLCQEQADYFKSVDSQFLLLLNEFSKEAFNILNLKLFYQSKCKVLMSIDSNVLYIYGNLFNSKQTYNYFCHYNNIIGKDNAFELSESKETILNLMCDELKIKLPNEIHNKSKIFIYLILKDRNQLFNQFDDLICGELKDLSIKSETSNELCGKNSQITHSNDIEKSESLNETTDSSRASQGSSKKFRTVIIDGGNVAHEHGNRKFSFMGIKFAIDYFLKRGHTKVYALLSRRWKPYGGEVFDKLECDGFLKYTPSRIINNVRETPHDDLLILDAAVATDGIVVSNDQYREHMAIEKYKNVICNRLIAYAFFADSIIFPVDPFGPGGPLLDDILIYHDEIQPVDKPQLQKFKRKINQQSSKSEIKGQQLKLFNQVIEIFPGQENVVKTIIMANPCVKNADQIINLVLMATNK